MSIINPGQPAFHGYAPGSSERAYRPPISIVISRETGARGRSIAERVSEILGWEYMDQESLEYLTQGPPSGTVGQREISGEAAEWVNARLSEMAADGTLIRSPQVAPLVKGILEAASDQHRVILGRGAGRVLPTASRLHVKIIAPMEFRTAVIAQMRRFSSSEAEQFIQEKDRSREEFLAAKLGVDYSDPAQFDMIVNTAQIGVEASARIIAQAAQEKQEYVRKYE